MNELKPPVKILVVENLGILMGSVSIVDAGSTLEKVNVAFPLFLAPSQGGQIAMQNNPLFQNELSVNAKYIIAESEPKPEMVEKYEAYRTQQNTGLVLPKSKIQL